MELITRLSAHIRECVAGSIDLLDPSTYSADTPEAKGNEVADTLAARGCAADSVQTCLTAVAPKLPLKRMKSPYPEVTAAI